MVPYIPPNRKRFVVPKKILDSSAKAPPLPSTIFPFEHLPADILIYLVTEHIDLPDLICLCLASKRFLHFLVSVDSNISPILHYADANSAPSLATAVQVRPKHDPSPSLLPVLRRLQSHNVLPREKIPCHSCCRVRRIGTMSYWWDICEEIYSEITWRRRRNDRTWADRRVIDYEYFEFEAAYVWAWKMWKLHQLGDNTTYRFAETAEGGYQIDGPSTDRKSVSQSRSTSTSPEAGGSSRNIREVRKAICPECWANVEARNFNRRPPLRV